MKKLTRRGVTITPELRRKIERLIELNEAHIAAIQDKPGAAAFYDDGRHEELVELIPQVHRPLGIKPWEPSPNERLKQALEDAAE